MVLSFKIKRVSKDFSIYTLDKVSNNITALAGIISSNFNTNAFVKSGFSTSKFWRYCCVNASRLWIMISYSNLAVISAVFLVKFDSRVINKLKSTSTNSLSKNPFLIISTSSFM